MGGSSSDYESLAAPHDTSVQAVTEHPTPQILLNRQEFIEHVQAIDVSKSLAATVFGDLVRHTEVQHKFNDRDPIPQTAEDVVYLDITRGPKGKALSGIYGAVVSISNLARELPHIQETLTFGERKMGICRQLVARLLADETEA